MLFLIVFLAKYLFFNWSYSTTSFEVIKIFFFVSKKNADTSVLNLFHNIDGIQKGCDINFCAVRLK